MSGTSPDTPVLIGVADSSGLTVPVGVDNALDVSVATIAAPTSVLSQQTTAGSSPVVQLSSQVLTTGLTIKADDDNAGSVYVGGTNSVSSTTGYRLKAGQNVFIACANANEVFIVATQASQRVHVIGS